MRWFKHLTTARHDESMAELLDECGLEGYGFYWVLLETVAASMDKTNRCGLTYSLPQWSRQLYCHHNKVSKYLGKLQVTGRVTVEYLEGKVRVTVPNLLKYRDEYTKKYGDSPDQETDTETDTDTQSETEQSAGDIAEDSTAKGGPALVKETPLQMATRDIAKRIWNRHPSHRRSKLPTVEKRLREAVKEIASVECKVQRMREIDARHARWCASEQWAGKGMVKNLGNWFTEGICDNEPEGALMPTPKHFDGRKPMFT